MREQTNSQKDFQTQWYSWKQTLLKENIFTVQSSVHIDICGQVIIKQTKWVMSALFEVWSRLRVPRMLAKINAETSPKARVLISKHSCDAVNIGGLQWLFREDLPLIEIGKTFLANGPEKTSTRGSTVWLCKLSSCQAMSLIFCAWVVSFFNMKKIVPH